MDDDSIGFSAKAPVSAWNKRIGVDYPGVFKALLNAALAAATANAPGAISAAIDGLFAFKVGDAKRPPEELAWLLTRRALARAMAELTVEAARRHGSPLQDKEGLVAALDNALDGADIWIDPAFFDRPADHSVVGAVKPQFHEWFVSLRLNDAEAESANHRLGAYFTFALRCEWAEHAETYRPIEAAIQKYDNLFTKADARERAWIRNADYLQRLIQEPVFEESFGLAQIYVPLRAWYREVAPSRKAREQTEEETRERRRVVDLERHLDGWFAGADKKDAIRVICGGPGSGKTSFAKVWAAKLARDGHRVLFVPLHRLELRDERPDLQAVLWEFLRDLGVLPVDPLDSSQGEPRLLILFDGLDELAMQGRAGQEVARNFFEAVERRLDLLNDRPDRFIQVAFGGRDIAVQAARLLGHQVLHVLPYHGAEGQFKDRHNLLEGEEYGCARWWRQFGRAVGESFDGIPEPLQNDDLLEITGQPLLNYLLALSYRRGQLDFSAAPNLNLIYGDLLDAVYDRRWGPGRHPIKKQLKLEEFDDLLDELGLAVWHGAGRTVTETQVEQTCERAGLQEQLLAFKEGARAGAISLLAAFYFRQAGKIEGERTFEFTHKSFGEYLIARRLARAIEDIHDDRELNRKNRQRGKTVEESLVSWIELTGPTSLNLDVLAFLEREVALKNKDAVSDWRACFGELFDDQLRYRLPMHRLQLPTYQDMARQARNAEEALLAALYTCAAAVDTRADGPTEHTKVAWPDMLALRDLLSRLSEGRRHPFAHRWLGWLDAQQQDLHCTDLGRANLGRADFREANLWGANLWMANLVGANLKNANLGSANLFGAKLESANLGGANLERADLERANLQGAEFRETNLRRADLGWANLGLANLAGANLFEANLGGANLESASLAGADLERANLRGADLRGAHLVGAQGLDEARGLNNVTSWDGAKIERRWVERLQLNPENLGLNIVDDLDGGMKPLKKAAGT
jgi:uncharacterized protein YjbI with pentapeptide repeats